MRGAVMILQRVVALCCMGLFACGGIARADNDSCWQRYYKAIERSAASPHAAFTTYAEDGKVTEDGVSVARLVQNITYRDDGVAVISDERWPNPIISNVVEPGPPILGPYGAHRSGWLSENDVAQPLPVIGDVHTHARHRCEEQDGISYAGRATTYIRFPDAPVDHPALKAIWLDPATLDALKVIVSGRLNIADSGPSPEANIADFEVEFQQVDGYTVVRHVTWRYHLKIFSQYATLFGEYYLHGYAFSDRAPIAALTSLEGRQ